MGSNTSLTEIGAMLVVNVLLISNYYFVLELRKTIDNATDLTYLEKIQESFGKIKIVVGFKKFYSTITKPSGGEERGKCSLTRVRNVAYSCILGKLKMEQCVAAKFPNWQPIPFKLGIISTSMALLFSTFLLSGPLDLLQDKLSVTANRESAGFCATDDFHAKMQDFKEHIDRDVTNYTLSNTQTNIFMSYRDAVSNDTDLYGEPEFECITDDGSPGTKESYYMNGKNKTHGPFFPGYCRRRLKMELNVLDAYTSVCKVKRRVCVDRALLAIICTTIEVDVPCHTLNNKDEDALSSLDKYREEEREISDENVTIESDADPDDLKHLQNKSAKILTTLLKQINIAGVIYSVYVVIALYFPIPLKLFRSPLKVQATQLIFGAGKYTFIAIVLIIWYGYHYLGNLIRSPEFNIYLKNIIVDPCFVDGKFIGERATFVRDVCSDLIEFENQMGLAKAQISQMNKQIGLFNNEDCACSHSPQYAGTNFNSVLLGLLVDNDADPAFFGFDLNGAYYMPNPDTLFLGNENICTNATYAREEILIAEDIGLSFWELWIASGLFAKLIVQVAITNFGLALLKLADPFCLCKGTYESPPANMSGRKCNDAEISMVADDKISLEEITEDKAADLKALAIRESLIWGFLANSSLLSLFVAALPNFGEFHKFDYILFGASIFVAMVIPFGCCMLTRRVKRAVLLSIDEAESQELNMLCKITNTLTDPLKHEKKPLNHGLFGGATKEKTIIDNFTETMQSTFNAITPSKSEERSSHTPLRSIGRKLSPSSDKKSIFTTALQPLVNFPFISKEERGAKK